PFQPPLPEVEQPVISLSVFAPTIRHRIRPRLMRQNRRHSRIDLLVLLRLIKHVNLALTVLLHRITNMLSRDRAPIMRDPAIPQVNLKPTDRLEHCLRAVRPPLHHNLVAVLLRPIADLRLPPERVAIHALNLVPVEHLIDSSVDLGTVILAAPLRRNPNRGPRVRAITRRELETVQRLRTERRAVRRTRQRAIETE